MSQPISLGGWQSIDASGQSELDQVTALDGRILLLAETGVVFQGLLQATQHSFPKFNVTLSDQLPDDAFSADPVRVVLLHSALSRDMGALITECRRRFPGTPIALMIDDARHEVPELGALLDAKLVQGLLPFSLQLNVWLAAIWLLLNGGEYYPVALMQTPTGRSSSSDHDGIGHAQEAPALKTLTARERQVLELVSQGYQNKLIAVKMALSEHTVKVHVHNVIRKLQVHNRTQAAAAFRNGSVRHRAPAEPAASGWWDKDRFIASEEY
jgi:DNA-binding NarL/FixJ family response regulator